MSLMPDLTQTFSAKDRLRPDNVGTVSTGGRGVSTSVCGHHQSREVLPAARRLSAGRLSQELPRGTSELFVTGTLH
jgi:hypothetical protein